MPEYEYSKDLKREWIGRIVNTLLRIKFNEFIINSMRAREKKLISNK